MEKLLSERVFWEGCFIDTPKNRVVTSSVILAPLSESRSIQIIEEPSDTAQLNEMLPFVT